MPSLVNDDEAADLVFLALVATGLYVLVNFWRNSQAGAGAPIFSPAPPPATPGDSLLNVLVPMQLSAAGEAFLKQQEGWTATAKNDGAKQVIGWGHDIQPGENIVGPITQAEGQSLFDADVAKAEQAVNSAVTVQLSQDQFDALVSLVFNIGAAAFQKSTLLRYLNQGNYNAAAAEIPRWKYSGGQVNNGLVQRRAAEQGLFIS